MRIAIFHNYMDNIGGAEIVTLTLARELGADIYTTNINQEKIAAMGFPEITPISIGRIPIQAPFRQQKALWLFRRLNLCPKYDFYIIAGDWAVSSAVNHKPNLWYVHSPIRELWDSYEYVRTNMVSTWKRPLFDLWVHYNRYLNKKHVAHVTAFACNAENTQQRLKKFLGKDAPIIHPPVNTSHYQYRPHQNYWLAVNRLINHKRVEIQLEAFRQLPEEKLIIVGSYEPSAHFVSYASHINATKPSNVEIRHSVAHDALIELYASAKGFITTARDEDFGLTPIEAMAAGKPVIAGNEGGYRETMLHNLTGKLIDDITPEKLARAVKEIGPHVETYRAACEQRAKEFDTKVFIAKIKDAIGYAE